MLHKNSMAEIHEKFLPARVFCIHLMVYGSIKCIVSSLTEKRDRHKAVTLVVVSLEVD